MDNHELTPEQIEKIMAERAARYAKISSDDKNVTSIAEVIILQVGDEKLGIPIGKLSYIIETPTIALLPHLPHFVEGIVQYRGDIFSIVNLVNWFSIAGKTKGSLSAVLETSHGRLGILIDKVLGFKTVYPKDVAENFNTAAGENSHPFMLTTTDAISVIDPEELVLREDLIVNLKN